MAASFDALRRRTPLQPGAGIIGAGEFPAEQPISHRACFG
jgi:hypothetical protein